MKKISSKNKTADINKDIIACERCPRLRKYCKTIAKEKRKQFMNDTYWGKPIPSFGDPSARLLIVGLAPAAHGANRTGRMFTGDNSGVWLYRALHKAGFANRAESSWKDDGLTLTDAYITATIHCAPPENKPLPKEIQNCSEYLVRELEAMKNVQVILVLGQIALKALWSVLPPELKPTRTLPKFSHGATVKLNDGRQLICSYHPSQQNTFTKKLTEPMFDSIFRTIISLNLA
jgi:uracil-DNA glycosylase family 4